MSLRAIAATILRGAAYIVDGGPFPQAQIATSKGEAEEAEHLQPFGLATWMPSGPLTDALVAHVGGCADHPVVLVMSSRALRPVDLLSGDTVLYDSRGNQVRLTALGVDLGGAGGAAVGRVGDSTQVTAASDAAFVGWIAAVSGFINGIAPGTIPAVPVTVTGTITTGSAVTRST